MFRSRVLLAILLAFGSCLSMVAQAPEGISYQAAAVSPQGDPLINQNVGVRFSLLPNSATASPIYVESHSINTDEAGLFELTIGSGEVSFSDVASFGDVDWSGGDFYIKVEMDFEGDGSFVWMGTQQLLSVPFSFYSDQAGTALDDGDRDPNNEIQQISYSDNEISLSNGGGSVNLTELPYNGPPNGGVWIECVDMGVSELCGGLGLDPNASLGPNSDGYSYRLSFSSSLNLDNYISQPHWRKFQLHGIQPEIIQNIRLSYQYDSSQDGWTNGVSGEIIPEISEADEVFFYLYRTSPNSGDQCVSSEGIGLAIPLESAWRIYGYDNDYRTFEIGYSNGTSLVFTGVVIDY